MMAKSAFTPHFSRGTPEALCESSHNRLLADTARYLFRSVRFGGVSARQ
jgi:hypothetical protein